jgi:Uma2 family endonuclease
VLQGRGRRDVPLISFPDDGIVVGMTTDDYLHSYETTRPRELTYGVVREPPAPFFSHQRVVLKIARVLADYVERESLGQIGIAPLDVILDAGRALIIQPDVLFVAAARLSLIRDQVWGAPDLVVEVLSPGTALHDRTEKLGWYRQYGVRECWLVDPATERVTVVDFTGGTPDVRTADRTGVVRSTIFNGFDPPVATLLA